ncbi:hypothetical protein B0J14DRAFT_564586 [Halenospora varia]|nr:hypothetical protein B0J14DRAFT_564586 [Halenospora varia]
MTSASFSDEIDKVLLDFLEDVAKEDLRDGLEEQRVRYLRYWEEVQRGQSVLESTSLVFPSEVRGKEQEGVLQGEVVVTEWPQGWWWVIWVWVHIFVMVGRFFRGADLSSMEFGEDGTWNKIIFKCFGTEVKMKRSSLLEVVASTPQCEPAPVQATTALISMKA